MSAQKNSFRDPPTINFDVLYHAARYTMLSPAFAIGLLLFTHVFQRGAPIDDPSKLIMTVYAGAVWSLWFGSWSSKVYNGKLWRKGFSGLTGLHRINWDGQIVLVTGGASGVGKAIVDILDTKSVTVVVLDRALPSSGSKEYNDVSFYECDVSSYASVQATANQIRKEVGNPTILINNAGIVIGKSILDLTEEEVTKTLSVNTLAHFWTIKAFLPNMIKAGRGHLVNVSSFLGTIGVAHLSDYCSSKSALIGLHDSLEAEIRNIPEQPNILVSTVFPGHIRTPLFARLGHFSAANAFFYPLLEPHQVAKAIVDRIEAEHGGELHLPILGNLSWIWRALPSWARHAVKWFSEADLLMQDFHKNDR